MKKDWIAAIRALKEKQPKNQPDGILIPRDLVKIFRKIKSSLL